MLDLVHFGPKHPQIVIETGDATQTHAALDPALDRARFVAAEIDVGVIAQDIDD